MILGWDFSYRMGFGFNENWEFKGCFLEKRLNGNVFEDYDILK